MNIICNGKERDVTPYKRLSYDEVVMLTYGPSATDSVFTVTYYGRKKRGTLTQGESVAIHNGVVFNCLHTNKA